MRITRSQDQAARAFLSRLESADRSPAPAQVERVEKKVSDFARVAVPSAIPGRSRKEDPAPWSHDRNEYVRHFKGTSFIAIGAIAKKVAMQEAKVYRRRVRRSGEKLEPVPRDHPLVRIFERPNPNYTQFDLWYSTIAWRCMTGDAFLWKARNGFHVPSELWPLPSQWTWAIPSETEFISDYLVRGVFDRPTYIPARDVIHMRESNIDWSGTGRFYGRPMAAAGAYQIDIESSILKRLYHHMKNFSPPGMQYSTERELTEDEFLEMFAQLRMQQLTSEETGEPILTHSGIKATEFRQSVREMDYGRSLQIVMEMILAIYGTPKAVVGLVHDVNRANLLGSLMAWCEGVVNPILVSLGQRLTLSLASDYDEDLVVKFDPCGVDDQEQIRRDVQAAQQAHAVTPDEVREILLNKGPLEWGGNQPLVGGNLVPGPMGNRPTGKPPKSVARRQDQPQNPLPTRGGAGGGEGGGGGPRDGRDAPRGGGDSPPAAGVRGAGEAEPTVADVPGDTLERGGNASRADRIIREFYGEGAAERLDPFAKALAAEWIAVHKRRESELAADLASHLAKQKRAVLRRFRKLFPRDGAPGQVAPEIVDDLLPEDGAQRLAELARPHVTRAGRQGGAMAVKSADLKKRYRLRKADPYPPPYDPLDAGGPIIQIAEETARAIDEFMDETYSRDYWKRLVDDVTRSRLREYINVGIETHLTPRQMMKMIEQDPSALFDRTRARRIARTETTTALNSGHYAANMALAADPDIGVVGREWLAVGDGDTRPSHLANDGRIAKQMDLFDVGGYAARFPGDPRLPASERIHCRCTLVEAYAEDLEKRRAPAVVAVAKKGEFGCVMCTMPADVARQARAIADRIDPADLIEREDEPHVTVLYGLRDDDPQAVKRVLRGRKLKMRLGKLSLFENEDADVLKLEVHSPGLVAAHNRLRTRLPNTQTRYEYRPHLTIGYLKRGTGRKYLQLDNPLEGRKVEVAGVTHSNKDRKHRRLRLDKTRPPASVAKFDPHPKHSPLDGTFEPKPGAPRSRFTSAGERSGKGSAVTAKRPKGPEGGPARAGGEGGGGKPKFSGHGEIAGDLAEAFDEAAARKLAADGKNTIERRFEWKNAVEDYTRHHFIQVNTALREDNLGGGPGALGEAPQGAPVPSFFGGPGLNPLPPEDVKFLVRDLNEAIRAHKLPEGTTLYRGVGDHRDGAAKMLAVARKLRDGEKVDDTFHDKAFTSSSLNPRVAHRFAKTPAGVERRVLLRIKAKNGLPVESVTTEKGEHEVISATATMYRIVGLHENIRVGTSRFQADVIDVEEVGIGERLAKSRGRRRRPRRASRGERKFNLDWEHLVWSVRKFDPHPRHNPQDGTFEPKPGAPRSRFTAAGDPSGRGSQVTAEIPKPPEGGPAEARRQSAAERLGGGEDDRLARPTEPDTIGAAVPLGGGMNDTYLAKLGETTVVYKPAGGEDGSKIRYYVDELGYKEGTQYKREVAASELYDEIGVDTFLVPKTRIVKGPRGEGSAQDYVEGAVSPRGDGLEAVLRSRRLAESGTDMHAFDIVIGNVDRHGGNWLVDKEHRKVVAIDSGLSFPNKNSSLALTPRPSFDFPPVIGPHTTHLGVGMKYRKSISPEMKAGLERLKAKRPAVDGKLAQLIGEDERTAMWERLDLVLANAENIPGIQGLLGEAVEQWMITSVSKRSDG